MQFGVVSRDEWKVALERLLEMERESIRQRDELNAERRAQPAVEIDKQYTFTGPHGPANLLRLFEGRRQLIVYHFMFHPDWGEGCQSCSHLADNIGHLAYLHAANTTLVLVSRAPFAKLEAYRKRMGWDVPWYSSYQSDFNEDFGVSVDDNEQPGASVFLRNGEDVYHTYSAYGRGNELLLGSVNYLNLTPLGPKDEDGMLTWVRRHDRHEFEDAAPSC